MNAAIEAAHAGDAGKGFAVVANEIRELAESSSEQSKTISMVLNKIKGSIDKVSESTDNTLTRFQVIDADVKTVSQQEGSIRNAMEEQSQGSKQILEAIGQLNEITRLVKDGSTEMLEGSHEVIKESKNLEHMTQEITGGINEMASGAQEINLAVNRINEITAKNRENINGLVREVSMFKVA
jgi:methyl-accepting chemotaxis protein